MVAPRAGTSPAPTDTDTGADTDADANIRQPACVNTDGPRSTNVCGNATTTNG
jgi:hypothetical protein